MMLLKASIQTISFKERWRRTSSSVIGAANLNRVYNCAIENDKKMPCYFYRFAIELIAI